MTPVQLKKVTVETINVQAQQIKALSATLDDETIADVPESASVGDWRITNEQGEVSFMTDAAFRAEQVPPQQTLTATVTMPGDENHPA